MLPRQLTRRRMPAMQKTATASLAATGAALLAFTLLPSPADGDGDSGRKTEGALTAAPASWQLPDSDIASQRESLESMHISALGLHEAEVKAAKAQAAKEKAAAEKQAAAKAAAEKQAAAEAKAAKERRAAEQAASRSETRSAPKSYANNLDGWIREALDIMARHGIPGTYEGLHRNIIRESSGDPRAVNDWDINARNGTPSIGLLQVIQPTFDAYHVPGTPHDLYHPVANLVAAANYAADRYGSIDNVDGPY